MTAAHAHAPHFALRTLPQVVAAALGMGTWALWANLAHPWPEPLRAALVQAALSATFTLVLKRVVEALAARLGTAAVAVAPLACATLSASALGLVHTLAGTPEVLATLAVPATVTTCYAITYALALLRAGAAP